MIHKLKTYDDHVLDRQLQELCAWTKHPEVAERGEGIVLRTPDGTKQYKISIDNSGSVITTLL